jgi:PAS domain S-box-containing protein/putative nucleotidyltransferase with HDIG domain
MAGQSEAFSLVTTSAIVALLLLVLLRQIAGVRENARLYTNLGRAHDGLEGCVRERTAELAKANEDLLVEVGERKKAEKRLQRQLKEFVVLSAVAGMAGEAPDEDTLLSRVTEIMRDQLYPDNCGVLLLDPVPGVLRHAGSYHRHSDIVKVEDVPTDRGIVGRVVRTGQPVLVPDVSQDPDYIPMDPTMRSEMAVPLKAGDRILGVLDAESGSPNAFSEEDERILTLLASQVAAALERLRGTVAMRESEERFRCLSDAAFEGIGISEGGLLIDVNARLGEILGYEAQEIVGRDINGLVAPRQEPRIPDSPRRRRGDAQEHGAIKKDGTWIAVETRGRDMPYHGRTVTVTAVRDITDWRRAEDRILLQLRRLAALRDIDAAINSRLDLKVTMGMFLEQVVAQLGVDAADVLLLNQQGGGLEMISSIGLPAQVLPVVHPLQESWAASAGQAQKVMAVLNASPGGQDRHDEWPLPPRVAACGFKSCYVAPLAVKGQAVGVLEVFALSPLKADREWMNFLETLAGQAAMAVDNRRLFESIRQSNSDLGEAYDTTLEGWSRALELRDRETQGHTLRVAEIALLLARAAGIPEDDLIHVRRGALLHDIGKMGIPDGILHKPGPLDEEEWAVMRRHTTYAHELLSPVEFLKPALDIPYCHHERWDGTGYPRGLKGEAIPLSARVFAVVDSWDALSHDRPYRPAWPSARVRDYLREKSGRHFEPRLVDLFLAMEK